MSLFDNRPITVEEIRLRMAIGEGGTIRKLSNRRPGGSVRTVRHKPWWMMLGKGPEGQTCKNCEFLARNVSSKSYLKCGRQLITRGPGTDIRAKDEACRLFQEAMDPPRQRDSSTRAS